MPSLKHQIVKRRTKIVIFKNRYFSTACFLLDLLNCIFGLITLFECVFFLWVVNYLLLFKKFNFHSKIAFHTKKK